MKNKILSLLVASVVTLTISCSTNTKQIQKNLKDAQQQADQYRNQLKDKGLTVEDSKYDVTIDEGIWVDTTTVKANSLFPDNIDNKRFTFIKLDPVNFSDLTQYLMQMTGIKVTRAHELIDKPPEKSASQQQSSTTQKEKNIEQERLKILTPYQANVRDLALHEWLDEIASSQGISWRYSKEEGIHFYYYTIKTFFVKNTNAAVRSEDEISSESETGGEGGQEGTESTSKQTINLTMDSEFWLRLSKTLKQMLSDGGKLEIHQSSGSVIINDNEHVIAHIGEYLNHLNSLLDLQVHMRITILRMQIDNADDLAITYDLIYNKKDGSIGLSTSAPNEASLSELTTTITNSKWLTTTAIIDALAKHGEVAVLTNEDILMNNYRPYHYRKGKTQRFISNISTVTTGTLGNTSESLEISELFLGLGITFNPNIHDKEHLIMDLVLTEQELLSETRFAIGRTTGDTRTITLPITSNQDLANTFNMRTGETRILAAFEQKRNSIENQGTATPKTILFGGSKSANETRELIIIIGTPNII